MSRSVTYRTLGVGFAIAAVLAALVVAFRKPVNLEADVLAVYDEKAKYNELALSYPLDGTLFPPEIPAPTFRWSDNTFGSDAWLVRFTFEDREGSPSFLAREAAWKPSDEQWEAIKRRSLERVARIAVIGFNHAAPKKILSSAAITIRTSKDEVGAPLFYREVNLPFVDAVKDPSLIRWRFGPVSSKTQPPIVLSGLPVCANCHSFSLNGAWMGMDTDYGNDKGSYVITRVEKNMTLARSKIITWSDYRRQDEEPTFGLLSQISPDGKYAVSTVKDRSMFAAQPELAFSQLFFPLKGILAIYRRDTGEFSALPGADDREFVQSNPSWSPDGKYIVFARSRAYTLRSVGKDVAKKVLLTSEEGSEFLQDGKPFLFDLYRVPFNDGKGGKAEPLEGASNNGMSNYFAKYSPDGKWIVFCKAKSYMLLRPDSRLYIMPADGGTPRRMRCNTAIMNSWHTWSPNSRWLVFSSKKYGAYTQLFLTHVDAEGNDSPAVLLDRFTSPDRAANIPEFVNTKPLAISKIREEFLDDLSYIRAAREFWNGNEYERSVEALRKALEINPENGDAHYKLGVELMVHGKTDEAAAQFTEAIRLRPNSWQAHNNLALLMLQQGNRAEAAAHFTEAIRLKPDLASAHINLGNILGQQGKVAEAAAHLTEVTRLQPDSWAARSNLGLLFSAAGRFNEAADEYAEAIRLRPDDEELHANLGVVLVRQGKTDEAAAQFAEAIRLSPEFAGAHNNLGAALRNLGKLDEAIAHFRRALELEPNFEAARLNLQAALQQKGSPQAER